MLLHIVNIFSIIVAALVSMVVGSLWYSPLMFGKQWMRLRGKTPVETQQMEFPASKMLIEFSSTLVTAFVLSLFTSIITPGLTASVAVPAALILAMIFWVGFYVPTLLAQVLWEEKPFGLFLITASLRLVNLVLMILVLVLWH